MTTAFFDLSSGNLSQNWDNAGLITANDDWSGVASIMGYRGDLLAPTIPTDPQLVVSEGTPVVDVNANQTLPNTFNTGGVTEFAIANPVVALTGSGTGQAPNLVLYLNATGRQDVTVSYLLRDIDGSVDNSVQPVALQYRIGGTGNFINVPAGYVADASGGPSTATQTNAVTVTLPAAVNGQAQVEVRIITTNATGNDEWIGIDDILVSSTAVSTTPVVNLSASANAGTEAGTTEITLTATASAPVTGDQTVDVTVRGTHITPGDYSLSSPQITILSGQTTGSVTFTVTDDMLVEVLETAVVTIGSPSAGLALGTTVSQNIAITDNDAIGSLAYDGITQNEARALDGSVSGKTLITLTGDTFTGANGDDLIAGFKAAASNLPEGLTAVLLRTSATTAELSYTGAAALHASANDTSAITLVFNDAAFTGNNAAAITASARTDLGIDFGNVGTPGAIQTFTPNTGTTQDSSDASTALALDANWMVVADDEANVLRVYSREGGPAVAEWSYATNGPLLAGGELDLEASTRIGDTLYFMGSHSNNKAGAESNSREFIFSVNVSGTGAATQFSYNGLNSGLEAALASWDAANTHGKGANYFGLAASSAGGVVPESVNGFSIEGLTATQSGTQLLLGFRAPQTGAAGTRDMAVIVPVEVAGLIGGGAPAFGAPIELNLGGRGIRSIELSPDGGYLIVAGPAASASTEATNDFRLFRWDGVSTTPTELDVSLDTLVSTTGGSFESIVDVRSTAAGTLVQLLTDNGDTVWPGQSQPSKDLAPELQKFQGTWVALGADVTDTAAPMLASSSPADDAVNAAVSADLVLRFSEGVKAGAGSFVIKKVSDGSVVETVVANSANVSVAYNTVTINPTANLAAGTAYYLEAGSTALLDHAGNAWSGLSGSAGFNFTTAAPAAPPKLLITEVNSNAGPADFFELYNYGTTTIDLSGFKWHDNGANFANATAFAPGTLLTAGDKLIVINTADAAAFRAAWNNLPVGVDVLATGGQGLGSSDAVVVFDASGGVVTAFNYQATAITVSGGGPVIQPAVRGDGVTTPGGHAGASMGGTATTSAVWNEQSTTNVKYTFAQAGQLGSFAQTGTAANVGSPGAPAGASLATPYIESFTTSLGDFVAYSVDADSVNTWSRISTPVTAAAANGFGDTAPANDWLISKGFDLAQTDVEYLSFTTWTQFTDAGISNPEVKVKWSNNYSGTGSPTSATWTDLSYTFSPEASQVITPSGLIDLSAISGNNVFFAFRYTSSGNAGSNSTSWRLDDFKLEGYTGAVVSIVPADAVKNEGDSGTTPFTFTVTRAGNVSATSTVDWAVSGAAVNAADFGGALPSGQVSFAANETSKLITINVSGDLTLEGNEAFTVTLTSAAGATIAVPSAVGNIQTDDVTITKISAVQGSGATAALNGQTVFIEGIVTAFMPGLQGFFIQEEAADHDGNAATSEGIFVFYGNTVPAGLSAASVGDVIRVGGVVGEFNGLTQLATPTNFTVITDNASQALPAPVVITLPVADMVNWEAVEGMRVQIVSGTAVDGKLVVTDNFNLGQFGQVTLTSDTLLQQFTETTAPSTSGWTAYQAATQKDQIILDDSNGVSNPDPNIFGRGGEPLSAANTLRGGDWVSSVTGVVDQRTAAGMLGYETSYRIQATDPVNFTGNARPTAGSLPAEVTGAEIKVASVNVLNYFNTFGTATFTNANGTSHEGRGATNAAEFERQTDKLVANILGLNADVVGLMEMQNNGFGNGTSAIDALVDALNLEAGAGTYAYVPGPYEDGNGADAVTAGDDAIMVAFIYKPSKVSLVGQAATPDLSNAEYNAFTAAFGSRAPVAQTFSAVGDGEIFTVVANHFKSKGSVNDPDIGDGQGANNQARMEAARDLLTWLATNPTGNADTDILLIGDFNAYSKEDPITYLEANGYDKVSMGLSYSFDGLWGSLDHAIASDSLTSQITGAVKWAINAEEPTVLDYNSEFKSAGQVNLFYADDAYRSSDHNPILIGLNLGPAGEPANPSADYDGDGKTDLLWRNNATGANIIWEGADSGQTQAVSTIADTNWKIAANADFNGDGKTDILWRNVTTGSAVIWQGADSSQLQGVTTIADPNWKIGAKGDFNGDGKGDLLWKNAVTGAAVIWKSADSTTTQEVSTIADTTWKLTAAGDFDGNRETDLLWRNTVSGASVIWDGADSSQAHAITTIADSNWKLTGVGDFDGDGKSDLFWRNATNGASVIWKNGDSASTQAVTTVADQSWKLIGTGDYDGDGKSDLLWRNAVNHDSVIWKSADSSQAQGVTVSPDGNWSVTPDTNVAPDDIKPAVAYDMNGDTTSDLLWYNTTDGTGVIWPGADQGAVQNVTTLPTNWRIAGIADFDGDSKTDLLWRNTTDGAGVIWRSGDNLQSQGISPIADSNWKIAGLGDFNADGKDDILWRNISTGANLSWNGGDSGQASDVTQIADQAWKAAGIGDFNGDGKDDILWRNATSGAAVIWNGASNSETTDVSTIADPAWKIAAIADFDGDNESDLLWRNNTTGANVIWKSADSGTSQAVTTIASQDWQVAAAGDYTGDGEADLIWHNQTTGGNVMWASADSAQATELVSIVGSDWTNPMQSGTWLKADGTYFG